MSTTERQRLEQEALQHLNRGSTDGALKAYLQILKLAPTDRRVRQKVGEIYLRQGRAADAEKHLREVSEGLMKDGSHRAAAAVLKQLVTLRPDAPELHFDLGECYYSAGYVADAKGCFEAAAKTWISMGKPLDAATAARRLAEISPGEIALRLRTAELLEAGDDNAGAAVVFGEVIEEFRRRGRVDEVGRVAELALRVKPDDVGLLLDAAGARVAAGEFKKALSALQTAFMAAPKEPRTLDLLSQAFAGAGQPDRGMKVLLELGRVMLDRGDHVGEVEALRRASAMVPEDTDVAGKLQAALERLGRFEKKLGSLSVCAPRNEVELRIVVRAEVFLRYGLFERAETDVRDGLGASADSLALLAALAEVMIAAGRKHEALAAMERIVPRAGAETTDVLDRMSMLRGVSEAADDEVIESAPLLSPEPVAPLAAVADDPTPGFEPTPAEEPASDVISNTGEEDEGDRLLRQGDMQGALMAWRRVLADDPLNETTLGKIAALRTALRSGAPPAVPQRKLTPFAPAAPGAPASPSVRAPPVAAPPAPVVAAPPIPAARPVAPVANVPAPARAAPAAVEQSTKVAPISDGTFAEIESEIVDDEPSARGLGGARGLISSGRAAEGLALAKGVDGLAARVVEARAYRELGDLAAALDVLRSATNEADEADAAYPDALFDLALLYSATAKHRSALRLLEELADLAPNYRPGDVQAKIRGLQPLAR